MSRLATSLFRRIREALGGSGLTRTDIERLSCEEVADLLYDYLDQELEDGVTARVEAHLGEGRCECKRALLLEIAFNDKVRASLDCGGAPASLRERIIRSLSG